LVYELLFGHPVIINRLGVFMNFKSIFLSLILFIALVMGTGAHADTSQAPDSVDLVQALQKIDETTLQTASLNQAESFRTLPQKLREQGVEISAPQEQQFNQLADSLSADANQPGLKDRMIQELKKSNPKLDLVALRSLQVLGYTGSVAFSFLLMPFEIPADFLSALVSGKPCFSDTSVFSGDAAGYVGAGIGFYYSFVTLSVIAGGAVIAPVILGPLGAEAIDQIVCAKKTQGNELKQFCANNSKVLSVMIGGAGKVSTEAGDFIHNLIAKPIDKVVNLFPHHPKPPAPPTLCSGVCSIWVYEVNDPIQKTTLSADSQYDLEIKCSDLAAASQSPWSVDVTSCGN
jgi:hypothetical protein